MGRIESFNVPWPPPGWSQFAGVGSSAGQSLAKDMARTRIFGLQYAIESVPIFRNDRRIHRHDVRIDGWEYSILNESTEYPVLSFSLYDRFEDGMPPSSFIDDIRAIGTAVPHTKLAATRAIGAGLFLIRHIAAGKVPDINRVLRIYKLRTGAPDDMRGALRLRIQEDLPDDLARQTQTAR